MRRVGARRYFSAYEFEEFVEASTGRIDPPEQHKAGAA